MKTYFAFSSEILQIYIVDNTVTNVPSTSTRTLRLPATYNIIIMIVGFSFGILSCIVVTVDKLNGNLIVVDEVAEDVFKYLVILSFIWMCTPKVWKVSVAVSCSYIEPSIVRRLCLCAIDRKLAPVVSILLIGCKVLDYYGIRPCSEYDAKTCVALRHLRFDVCRNAK